LTSSTIFLQSAMAGGHRHGAGDVLAGLQGLDAHPAVVGDGRIDVDGVDVRVLSIALKSV
jgi:hypothetical protein